MQMEGEHCPFWGTESAFYSRTRRKETGTVSFYYLWTLKRRAGRPNKEGMRWWWAYSGGGATNTIIPVRVGG